MFIRPLSHEIPDSALNGGPFSGSLSAYTSNTNGTATWQSITQPSGIFAGDGGYHVAVGGDLAMTSGVIGSTTPDGNSLSVAGTSTFDTLTNATGESIHSQSSSLTLSTNVTQMLLANATAMAGSLAQGLGGTNSAQSATTPNLITGCPTGSGTALTCGTTRYDATAQGAIANPDTNLAITIASQQQTNAALAAASAAVASTLGDLFGQYGAHGAGLVIKSLLQGATQAGLGALAGESTSGILASGLAGAAADPLGSVVNNTLCGEGSACKQQQDQDAATCRASQGTNCSAYINDMAVIKGEIDAITSLAGIAIGAAAGDVQAGEAAANSVVLNNKLTHEQTTARVFAFLACKMDIACAQIVKNYYDAIDTKTDALDQLNNDVAVASQADDDLENLQESGTATQEQLSVAQWKVDNAYNLVDTDNILLQAALTVALAAENAYYQMKQGKLYSDIANVSDSNNPNNLDIAAQAAKDNLDNASPADENAAIDAALVAGRAYQAGAVKEVIDAQQAYDVANQALQTTQMQKNLAQNNLDALTINSDPDNLPNYQEIQDAQIALNVANSNLFIASMQFNQAKIELNNQNADSFSEIDDALDNFPPMRQNIIDGIVVNARTDQDFVNIQDALDNESLGKIALYQQYNLSIVAVKFPMEYDGYMKSAYAVSPSNYGDGVDGAPKGK